jgi:hypothetical protein
MLQIHATSINRIGSSTEHGHTQNTDKQEGLWPGPGTRGPGPGTMGPTGYIYIKATALGKAHANVLIIVVPFGSNFTG